MATKLTKTSLAKRRANALNKLNAKPDTLAKYEHDIKVINNSTMSALKKKAAIEKISARFVKSKTSTVSGIKDTFKKMKAAGMISKKGKAAIKSVSDMSDYINASQVGRRFMEAKALGLASDQIKYAIDKLKDTGLSPKKQSEHLYNIMAEITDMIIDNQQPPSADVYDMIDDYMNVLS